MCVCVCMRMAVCVYMCVRESALVCMPVCVCVYACVCLCVRESAPLCVKDLEEARADILKVSLLFNGLCNTTIWLTFENFHQAKIEQARTLVPSNNALFREVVTLHISQVEILKSRFAARCSTT